MGDELFLNCDCAQSRSPWTFQILAHPLSHVSSDTSSSHNDLLQRELSFTTLVSFLHQREAQPLSLQRQLASLNLQASCGSSSKSSKTHWIQWTLQSLLYVHLALHLLMGPEDDFRFIPNLLSTELPQLVRPSGWKGHAARPNPQKTSLSSSAEDPSTLKMDNKT